MPYTVYFHDMEFDDAGEGEFGPEGYSYELPYLGDANGKASVFNQTETGLAGELVGQPIPSYLKLRPEEKEILKVFLPAMKDAGVQRCILSYDGGSDEGFGQLVSCEDVNGSQVSIETILSNEAFLTAVTPYLKSEQEKAKMQPFYRGGPEQSVADLARSYLDYEVATIAVSVLLGSGYGTGEYQLYGRAFLDLEEMSITDDKDAPYPHGTPV